MPRYISTRGGGTPQTFSSVALEGLAPDGGLYWPEEFPQFTHAELGRLRGKSYQEVVMAVVLKFAPDYPKRELHDIAYKAYTLAAFGTEEITPIRKMEDGLYLLELSNGPTLAFKDLPLRFLALLTDNELKKSGGHLCILGATSGDTGSAAEEAFRHCERAHVVMLSPEGRLSPFQRKQMYTINHPRIHNLMVEGTFDDCQGMVKKVNCDHEFKARHKIGAVNSINLVRIIAQVGYIVDTWLRATQANDEHVSFSIPSGNFGNALAVYVARRMGLPIGPIIIATNKNDVLPQFFRTDFYRARKGSEVFATTSPSMDIAEASNLERLIFEIVGRDPVILRELYAKVREEGFSIREFGWDSADLNAFNSGVCSEEEVIETIRQFWWKYNRLIDPHTAIAWKVGMQFRQEAIPLIVAETAQPAKFRNTIRAAVGFDPPVPDRYKGLFELEEHFTRIKPDVTEVKNYIAQHIRFD